MTIDRKEYRRRWYNRPENKEAAYLYYQGLKYEVMSHYCGGPLRCMCPGCDVNRLEWLTIDHIEGGGTAHRKRAKKHISLWLKKNNFPPGFQVLCFNCNASRFYYEVCPHQGQTKLDLVLQKCPDGTFKTIEQFKVNREQRVIQHEQVLDILGDI